MCSITYIAPQWEGYTRAVAVASADRIVTHTFRCALANRDLYLYTAEMYVLECCKYIEHIYPLHHQYFLSTRALTRFSMSFRIHWATTPLHCFIHVSRDQQLRGFFDPYAAIYICDGRNTTAAQRAVAAGILTRVADTKMIILHYY